VGVGEEGKGKSENNTIRTIVLKKRKDENKEHYKDGKITMSRGQM
jgi:hypothetical protein